MKNEKNSSQWKKMMKKEKRTGILRVFGPLFSWLL